MKIVVVIPGKYLYACASIKEEGLSGNAYKLECNAVLHACLYI